MKPQKFVAVRLNDYDFDEMYNTFGIRLVNYHNSISPGVIGFSYEIIDNDKFMLFMIKHPELILSYE